MGRRRRLVAALREPYASGALDAVEPVDPVTAFTLLFREAVEPGLVDYIERLYAEAREQKPGYVYVFRWTGAPRNVLKIGSSYDVDGRMTQWRATLGAAEHELQATTRVYTRERELAEAVVHALLERRRRPQPNPRQSYFHEEFFEVGAHARTLQLLILAVARHVSYYAYSMPGVEDQRTRAAVGVSREAR